MEQFNLDTWLQDKSRKICTRDGRPVRIVCWDLKCNTPIIAAIQWNQEREDCYCYNTIGRCANDVAEIDLFFADKEEELTEFERELEMMMVSFSNGNLSSDVRKEMPKQKLHNYAHRLLDIARKEISKDNVIVTLSEWETLTEKFKDSLKWKKITKREQNYLAYGYLSHDGYYLSIQELKDKLPKEE